MHLVLSEIAEKIFTSETLLSMRHSRENSARKIHSRPQNHGLYTSDLIGLSLAITFHAVIDCGLLAIVSQQ